MGLASMEKSQSLPLDRRNKCLSPTGINKGHLFRWAEIPTELGTFLFRESNWPIVFLHDLEPLSFFADSIRGLVHHPVQCGILQSTRAPHGAA